MQCGQKQKTHTHAHKKLLHSVVLLEVILVFVIFETIKKWIIYYKMLLGNKI